MPTRRMKARVIREALRLKSMGFSVRQISRSVNRSTGAVWKIIRKAEQAGLRFPLPEDMDDDRLESLLYPESSEEVPGRKPVPDWSETDRDLRRKGVTMRLLWEEYSAQYPGNHYSYSQFCKLFGSWRGKNKKPSMRQLHKAGDKCFVDYAGQTVPITDSKTGKQRKAHIFVGVLGVSSYTFAEAAWSQSLEDWLGSHTRMLEFFGGVPALIVPDNLKSAVSSASRYDPELNPAYVRWADYYGTAIMPTRPYKPQDKAKAEAGVLNVERRILAKLRDRTFFSLQELNACIRKLLVEINDSSFQKLEGSRRSRFEETDKRALLPLPAHPYRHMDIKSAKAAVDYHVEYKKIRYSVPCGFRGERVEIHADSRIVEVYFKNRLIATHKRSYEEPCVTNSAHMPESHREYERWSPERLRSWAASIGEEALEWVERQLSSRKHPMQACRVCLGLLSLHRDYPERLNAACGVVNRKGLTRLENVKQVLKNGMDKLPLFEQEESTELSQDHKNIRGPEQYQ